MLSILTLMFASLSFSSAQDVDHVYNAMVYFEKDPQTKKAAEVLKRMLNSMKSNPQDKAKIRQAHDEFLRLCHCEKFWESDLLSRLASQESSKDVQKAREEAMRFATAGGLLTIGANFAGLGLDGNPPLKMAESPANYIKGILGTGPDTKNYGEPASIADIFERPGEQEALARHSRKIAERIVRSQPGVSAGTGGAGGPLFTEPQQLRHIENVRFGLFAKPALEYVQFAKEMQKPSTHPEFALRVLNALPFLHETVGSYLQELEKAGQSDINYNSATAGFEIKKGSALHKKARVMKVLLDRIAKLKSEFEGSKSPQEKNIWLRKHPDLIRGDITKNPGVRAGRLNHELEIGEATGLLGRESLYAALGDVRNNDTEVTAKLEIEAINAGAIAEGLANADAVLIPVDLALTVATLGTAGAAVAARKGLLTGARVLGGQLAKQAGKAAAAGAARVGLTTSSSLSGFLTLRGGTAVARGLVSGLRLGTGAQTGPEEAKAMGILGDMVSIFALPLGLKGLRELAAVAGGNQATKITKIAAVTGMTFERAAAASKIALPYFKAGITSASMLLATGSLFEAGKNLAYAKQICIGNGDPNPDACAKKIQKQALAQLAMLAATMALNSMEGKVVGTWAKFSKTPSDLNCGGDKAPTCESPQVAAASPIPSRTREVLRKGVKAAVQGTKENLAKLQVAIINRLRVVDFDFGNIVERLQDTDLKKLAAIPADGVEKIKSAIVALQNRLPGKKKEIQDAVVAAFNGCGIKLRAVRARAPSYPPMLAKILETKPKLREETLHTPREMQLPRPALLAVF